MNPVFSSHGKALTVQKLYPGVTATGFTSSNYIYEQFILNFDTGWAEIKEKDIVKGEATGAFGNVRRMTKSDATWGGSTYGSLYLDSWNGIAFSDNENLQVVSGAAQSTKASVAGSTFKSAPDWYAHKGAMARAALIQIKSNSALCSWWGMRPDAGVTNTSVDLIGVTLDAGQSLYLDDYDQIANFYCTDVAVAASSYVTGVFYF